MIWDQYIRSHIMMNNVDYLVIETGYTSRILRSKNLIPEYMDTDDSGDQQPQTNREVLQKLKCVYIKDTLWGSKAISDFLVRADGVYAVANQEEVEKVRSVMKKNFEDQGGEPDGIIVFKDITLNKAFRIAALLQELDYCSCFDLGTLYTVEIAETDGFKVLYLFFDTESG